MTGTMLAAIGTAWSVVLMSAVWALARRIRNAGIVDIAWAANFTPLALLYAFGGTGDPARRALAGLLVCAWSLRLAGHLAFRVLGHHPVEDGRYARLRVEWAPNVEAKFLGFFVAQGLLNVALSIPILLACLNAAPGLRPLDGAAAALLAVAVAGEAAADRQLSAFRADPANRGRTCRRGLWRLSRHPNYFFEWLAWVAFFVLALPSPWGPATIAVPLLMLWLLFRVTGIPATEAQALRSRGDDYRDYQRTTSPFVPWFPKSPAGKEEAGR